MKSFLPELNFFERLIANVFKDYTFKIYIKGVRDGFNWKECFDHDLSTKN